MSPENPKPKVLLILERSEDSSVRVGLVKDCGGSMPMDTSACTNVGTWSRFDAGTLYVELTTPVDALQDALIQLISERAKSQEEATYPIIFHQEEARRPRRTVPVHETPVIDFSSLRSRLGK